MGCPSLETGLAGHGSELAAVHRAEGRLGAPSPGRLGRLGAQGLPQQER